VHSSHSNWSKWATECFTHFEKTKKTSILGDSIPPLLALLELMITISDTKGFVAQRYEFAVAAVKQSLSVAGRHLLAPTGKEDITD
jgi:hypothetical protein